MAVVALPSAECRQRRVDGEKRNAWDRIGIHATHAGRSHEHGAKLPSY